MHIVPGGFALTSAVGLWRRGEKNNNSIYLAVPSPGQSNRYEKIILQFYQERLDDLEYWNLHGFAAFAWGVCAKYAAAKTNFLLDEN